MQYVKLRKNGEVYLELKTEIGGEVVVMVYEIKMILNKKKICVSMRLFILQHIIVGTVKITFFC